MIVTNVDTSYGEDGAKVKLNYINYNSILGKYTGTGEDGGAVNPTQITRGTLRFDQNCYRWSEGFVSINGKVQFNNITGNMNKSGMMEYVSSGARYQSYLIKDDSGTILGVAFEQIGTGN